LAKAGKKVLILEAQDYIGGRTHHQNVPLLDGTHFNFEFGANFIHGAIE
jgi:phytoene dehydrogenase-like protein